MFGFELGAKKSYPSRYRMETLSAGIENRFVARIILGMQKLLPVLLVTIALFGVSTVLSHAEPPYHLTTVSWLIATRNNIDVDDHYVTLIGHVTGRKGDETYFFTDGTGMIRLDSEKFELPVGPRLVIGGRIDQAYLGFGDLEVDVRQWHFARRP